MNVLKLIGRKEPLFEVDITTNANKINSIVESSSFLVIGGAGSIGQAVVKEIFKRNPLKLHVVDISENNMVELVRDIRSTYGYISGDFRTFSLDIGSLEYDAFIKSDGKYDYVLNLSALKHVRSEKDPFTLMRMIDVNVFNTIKTILPIFLFTTDGCSRWNFFVYRHRHLLRMIYAFNCIGIMISQLRHILFACTKLSQLFQAAMTD